jgi:hypothetical protein
MGSYSRYPKHIRVMGVNPRAIQPLCQPAIFEKYDIANSNGILKKNVTNVLCRNQTLKVMSTATINYDALHLKA